MCWKFYNKPIAGLCCEVWNNSCIWLAIHIYIFFFIFIYIYIWLPFFCWNCLLRILYIIIMGVLVQCSCLDCLVPWYFILILSDFEINISSSSSTWLNIMKVQITVAVCYDWMDNQQDVFRHVAAYDLVPVFTHNLATWFMVLYTVEVKLSCRPLIYLKCHFITRFA